MGVLTPDAVERFRRDGYLRFRKVIDDSRRERLVRALERTRREELTRDDYSRLPPEFAYGHDRKDEVPASRTLHQFVNIWKVVPKYHEVIHDPVITGAIR